MALMRPFYDEGYYRRWLAEQGDRLVGTKDNFGNATIRTEATVDVAALARLAATAPHTLSIGAGTGPISVRVLVETPNPTRGGRGWHWKKSAALAKRQRQAVEAVLFGSAPPPAPWVVTMTRASAGSLDDDNLRPAMKHIRDQIAVWLLSGKPGENDDSPLIEWHYRQRPGKRNQPCVDISIVTAPEARP